jgi:hypothetical protein
VEIQVIFFFEFIVTCGVITADSNNFGVKCGQVIPGITQAARLNSTARRIVLWVEI